MNDQRPLDRAEPARAGATRTARSAYRRGPRAVAGLSLAVGLLVSAGCHAGDPSPTAPGAAGTATPAASATAGDGGPPSGGATDTGPKPGTSGGVAGTAECRIGQLKVSVGSSGAAAGHFGIVLLFANTGSTRCYLRGYPGVAGLDANGKQATQARRTLHGYIGGLSASATEPPRVELAPGATASASLEGSNVPRGDATNCPVYHGLLVTPPDETHSVRLPASANGCNGLEVHPVVDGTSGDQTPR